MAKSKQAALGFIFITILIDSIGFGLIIPVMQDLISELKHVPVNEASTAGGILLSTYALMQFLCAPIIGNLSDKYGRRPIILFSLFGFAIDYVFLSFAPTYGWLFVGRVVAGITGASFTTAMAYIADISTPENRAKYFGMVGGAFGLGFIIGPAIGGLLGKFGLRAPFYAAGVLTIINWLYGYFILPESLSADHRREFEWKRANPVGTLLQLKKYPAIAGLLASLVFIYLAAHAVQSNWNYFTSYLFKWSPEIIGFSLALVGALIALVQVGLIRIITPKIGTEKSIYVGLGLYTLGLFLFAFANKSWMMFIFLIPYCLGGIAGPSLQATMTGHVPKNEQGELQGGLTSLIALTSIVGPLIMTGLFTYFTSPKAPFLFPGAPFLLGGIFMLLSCLIAYTALRKAPVTPVASH
ncbi:MAG: TCR/Tet family MFS transporter [Bacteroidetes bacterium]|nr:TCR/Tet family MFS transporter [Bacteroidota bacterium]MBS1973193.1 TCR/Tet family MFS transporter [Bacteroidota bacterium]